jgi:hypothetical protein
MKLTGLLKIYKELIAHKENYYIFPFKKNNTFFEVLFDIYKNPYKLHFLQRESNFNFMVHVKEGFIINPTLDNDVYRKLCKALNLKYDPENKFSPFAFFNEFNDKIPDFTVREKRERELLKFYSSDIEEPDKLYFDCFIEWEKTDTGNHVTQKNLDKTRILFPEYYDYCERENVSIRYTWKNENLQNDDTHYHG